MTITENNLVNSANSAIEDYENQLKRRHAYDLGHASRYHYIEDTHVPEEIKNGSKEIIENYLAGLFPYYADGYYHCYSTNKDFMNDLSTIMSSIGINNEIYEFENQGHKYGIKSIRGNKLNDQL